MRSEDPCAAYEARLDAYHDGELPTTEALATAAHLAGCEACAARYTALRDTMSALRIHLPPLRAPATLRAQLGAALAAAHAAERTAAEGMTQVRTRGWTRAWRPWLVAAGIALLAGTAFVAGHGGSFASRPARDDLMVAMHVRSLQPGHLIDVASADQHTVKPWFAGKLDYAPTVPRLEEDGFPLIGGRLDYAGGRTVAAIVYGRRAHVINVLTWPEASPGGRAPRLVSRDGFQIANWALGGMTYWVVSDLNAEELRTFCAAMRRRIGAS